MRTFTSILGDGIVIIYPDVFVLSGNKNIVQISGATAYETFTLFGDKRELIAGAGWFDLSVYFKNLFVNEDFSSKFSPKILSLELIFGNATEYLTMDFTVFYGKNEVGDVRTLPKKAFYTEYSAWFDLWFPEATPYRIKGVDAVLSAGMNSLDLSSYTGDVLITFSNTFTDIFDETFYVGYDNILIQRVSCPENGVLLRWLDRWGIWQQAVLDLLKTNRGAKGTTYVWNNSSNSVYYRGLNISEKERTKTIDVIAPYVDLEEAQRLSDIVDAPFIHMYDFATSTWMPVTLGSSSIPVDETKPSQNVAFNIIVQNGF
jgi:hypothetical protein